MDLAEAILTNSVCDLRCWLAVEDVCRCRCFGVNHGIVRDGGDRPERTKSKVGIYYKLIAVGDVSDANRIERDDYYGWLKGIGYKKAKELGYYPKDRILINKATKSQLKWDEVQANKVESRSGKDRTYLIWEREDTPAFWEPYTRK